ncbi:MAG: hypothetical protein M1128_01225 [Candidatus Marsarchaeota archaeon]|nr:hypothetical protein [Candidatus Marsarchaeota archaeon]
MPSFKDTLEPNACIFGAVITGGKKRADKKGPLYYKLHKFECGIYKECNDKNKNFVLSSYGYYKPLDGTLGTKLIGSVGFIECVEDGQYLESSSKKHPPKTGTHSSYFSAKGEHVVCHFDAKIQDIQGPVKRYSVIKDKVKL